MRAHANFQSKTGRSRWTIYALSLAAIILLVSAYGSYQEMHDGRAPAPDRPSSQAAYRAVQEYFRAKELPGGWALGGVDQDEPRRFVASFHYSPRPTDPRYGLAAPAGGVEPSSLCPTEAAALRQAGVQALRVRTSDKTGILQEATCAGFDGGVTRAADPGASAH